MSAFSFEVCSHEKHFLGVVAFFWVLGWDCIEINSGPDAMDLFRRLVKILDERLPEVLTHGENSVQAIINGFLVGHGGKGEGGWHGNGCKRVGEPLRHVSVVVGKAALARLGDRGRVEEGTELNQGHFGWNGCHFLSDDASQGIPIPWMEIIAEAPYGTVGMKTAGEVNQPLDASDIASISAVEDALALTFEEKVSANPRPASRMERVHSDQGTSDKSMDERLVFLHFALYHRKIHKSTSCARSNSVLIYAMYQRFRQAALSFMEAFGVRLVKLHNARRGTDPFLFARPFALWREQFGVEAPVIFDVGGNFGDVTAAFKKAFPSARIFAFEPSPAVGEKLEQRFRGESNIEVCRLAMGKEEGSLPFQPRADDPLLGRLVDEATADTVNVEVTTVDSFMEKHSVFGIMILKTDTEGNELDVLAGAQKSLGAGLIQSVLVETSPWPRNRRHVALRDLLDFLTPLGFDLHGLYDPGFRSDGSMSFCNALFVRRGEAKG